MSDENKRKNAEKPISLAPLDFERALGGILQAGPHVEDGDDAPESVKEHHERKHRRRRSADKEAPPQS